MSDWLLQTQQLSFGYPPHKMIAENIAVGLKSGELVCLIGPNGVGKSTLLRTLAGMQKPLGGRVLLMGEDVHQLSAKALARRLSVVLTERVDTGLLSGYALVALGRHPYTGWLGRLSPQDEAVVRWAIEAVGATSLAEYAVAELSDGERQKFMIARALAQEPSLMLLDEPTAYLDLPRRVEILQLLRVIARNTGRAILLSTHDLELALRLSDAIWLLGVDGCFYHGLPEELVLSGAFTRVFQGIFDVQTGSFQIGSRPSAMVALQGDGLATMWTRRALERNGFTTDDEAPTKIEVLAHGEKPQWRLWQDSQMQVFDALGDLLDALKR